MKCSLGISNFLEGSLDFPFLLFSSISLHWSLRKVFLSLLAILWNSAFRWVIFPFLLCFSLLFFSQLFVRPLQTAIVIFCFLFLGDGLDPCLLYRYNVTNLFPLFQALCQSDLIPWIHLSLPLYNRKWFDLTIWTCILLFYDISSLHDIKFIVLLLTIYVLCYGFFSTFLHLNTYLKFHLPNLLLDYYTLFQSDI